MKVTKLLAKVRATAVEIQMDFKGVCMNCIDIQNIQLKTICGWLNYNFYQPDLKTQTKTWLGFLSQAKCMLIV